MKPHILERPARRSNLGDRVCSFDRRQALALCAAFLLGVVLTSAHAQEATADRIVVEADRLPDAESGAPFSVRAIEAEELERAPQLRLDDILRAEVPGFSLFRRSSSRTANPTTQGVTLRNFGPSGADRTLVLLDGIPLNDPFAGYVLWSQVPPGSLDSVFVNSGGGAGLFGNAALAGTIFLESKTLEKSGASAEVSGGNHDTYEASVDGTIAHAPFALAAFVERFSTGGYPVIAASQRGAVDRDASAQSDLVDLRWEWQIDHETSLRVRGRGFDDERENGTAFTHNDTIGADVSAVLTRKLSADTSALRLSVYGQHRKFTSTFSSENAARDVETPALDQFDVPANAAGGSAVWSFVAGGNHRLTLGSDVRYVEGETNEAYFWDGLQFTRLRRAGGRQVFAGLFTEDTWTLSDRTTVVANLRYDHWNLLDAFRRETDRETGNVRADSHFADRNGNELNGRIGTRFNATQQLAFRAAFYSGFRVPTLNELYRPFRVGNDVTEANPALKPEQLLGGEAGLEWQASQALRLTGTAFLNRLEDAVSNVTIGVGPGTFDPGGFIPAGGVLRQRQNVDLVVAPGAETTATWQLAKSFSLKGSYLFTHPTIEKSADPALEGKLLAQTPEHVFTAGVDWSPIRKWTTTAQLRYSDRQFEDDQNSRVLAPFTTVDAAIMYDFSARVSAAIRVENLFNKQVETGKSADGLVSIGTPRLVSFQLRWQM